MVFPRRKKKFIPSKKKPRQRRLYHPGVSVRGKVSQVLFLPATPVVFRTFPKETQRDIYYFSWCNRSTGTIIPLVQSYHCFCGISRLKWKTYLRQRERENNKLCVFSEAFLSLDSCGTSLVAAQMLFQFVPKETCIGSCALQAAFIQNNGCQSRVGSV